MATWDDAAAAAHNDFAAVVAGVTPRSAPCSSGFRAAGAAIALLAGSGSTVFGIFDAAPDVSSMSLGDNVRVISTWTSDRVERVTVEQ